MSGKLELLHEGRGIVVHAEQAVVGRRKDCALRVIHPLVSRQHCRFELSPRGVLLVDLGSSNGTYVNGERVEGSIPLRCNDWVSMGSQGPKLQLLRAELDGEDISGWDPQAMQDTMVADTPVASDFDVNISVSPHAQLDDELDEIASRSTPLSVARPLDDPISIPVAKPLTTGSAFLDPEELDGLGDLPPGFRVRGPGDSRDDETHPPDLLDEVDEAGWEAETLSRSDAPADPAAWSDDDYDSRDDLETGYHHERGDDLDTGEHYDTSTRDETGAYDETGDHVDTGALLGHDDDGETRALSADDGARPAYPSQPAVPPAPPPPRPVSTTPPVHSAAAGPPPGWVSPPPAAPPAAAEPARGARPRRRSGALAAGVAVGLGAGLLLVAALAVFSSLPETLHELAPGLRTFQVPEDGE